MSAVRMFDKLGNKARAKIVCPIPGGAICKITDDGFRVSKPVEVLEE